MDDGVRADRSQDGWDGRTRSPGFLGLSRIHRSDGRTRSPGSLGWSRIHRSDDRMSSPGFLGLNRIHRSDDPTRIRDSDPGPANLNGGQGENRNELADGNPDGNPDVSRDASRDVIAPQALDCRTRRDDRHGESNRARNDPDAARARCASEPRSCHPDGRTSAPSWVASKDGQRNDRNHPTAVRPTPRDAGLDDGTPGGQAGAGSQWDGRGGKTVRNGTAGDGGQGRRDVDSFLRSGKAPGETERMNFGDGAHVVGGIRQRHGREDLLLGTRRIANGLKI